MATRRTGYDVGALKEAIKRADVTIATFEAAIVKEQATQAEYRRMIREIQLRAEVPQITVEVVREDEKE
jgi:hypothetical protein